MLGIRKAETQDADSAFQVLRDAIEQLCVADHENDAQVLD